MSIKHCAPAGGRADPLCFAAGRRAAAQRSDGAEAAAAGAGGLARGGGAVLGVGGVRGAGGAGGVPAASTWSVRLRSGAYCILSRVGALHPAMTAVDAAAAAAIHLYQHRRN